MAPDECCKIVRAWVGVGELLRVRVPVGTFGRALINEGNDCNNE